MDNPIPTRSRGSQKDHSLGFKLAVVKQKLLKKLHKLYVFRLFIGIDRRELEIQILHQLGVQ
jgi:hypothetical protein